MGICLPYLFQNTSRTTMGFKVMGYNLLSVALLYVSCQQNLMQRAFTPVAEALGVSLSPWLALFLVYVFCKAMGDKHEHRDFMVTLLIAHAAGVECLELTWWYVVAHLVSHFSKQISDMIPEGVREHVMDGIAGVWELAMPFILAKAAGLQIPGF